MNLHSISSRAQRAKRAVRSFTEKPDGQAHPHIDFITKLGPLFVVVLIAQLPSEEAILSL